MPCGRYLSFSARPSVYFAIAAFSLSKRIWSFSAKLSHRARRGSGSSAHSSFTIFVRSFTVASGKSPCGAACQNNPGKTKRTRLWARRTCTPSFIALLKNMNAVLGLRTFRALYFGGAFRFSMTTWTFCEDFFFAGARFLVSWCAACSALAGG